jgi:hypothetical protein
MKVFVEFFQIPRQPIMRCKMTETTRPLKIIHGIYGALVLISYVAVIKEMTVGICGILLLAIIGFVDRIPYPIKILTIIGVVIFGLTCRPTHYETKLRVGNIAQDGTFSTATGGGAASHHGGVKRWVHEKVEIPKLMYVFWYFLLTIYPLGMAYDITQKWLKKQDA